MEGSCRRLIEPGCKNCRKARNGSSGASQIYITAYRHRSRCGTLCI